MLRIIGSARFLALLAVGLIVATGCTAAGIWQIKRFNEKRHANAELRHNDAQAAVALDGLLAVGRPAGDDLRFRTVVATGRYDVAGQVLVRQQEVNQQPGFFVLTPLLTPRGSVLLVVRGFVPFTEAATDTPTIPTPPAGVTTVTGRVYASDSGGLGTGLPRAQIDRIDVPAFGARLGVPTYGGYVELVSADPSDPRLAPLPPPDMSNPAGGAFTAQHLAYVVQWFLFALLALAAAPVFTVLDLRRATQGPRRDRVDDDLDSDLDGDLDSDLDGDADGDLTPSGAPPRDRDADR